MTASVETPKLLNQLRLHQDFRQEIGFTMLTGVRLLPFLLFPIPSSV